MKQKIKNSKIMIKKLVSMLLIFMSINTFAQIERIEPSSWWVGMKYNEPMLLIYGNDISSLQPAIQYPGVKIIKIETVENKNYLFVTLHIDDNAKAGIVKINFSINNKLVYTRDFPIENRVKNSANRQGFSQKDAICLIFPDRFANGDTTNDIVAGMTETTIDRNGENSRHGGDIQGIINHLDYLQSLGYTQIWNTPLTENDEPTYSYHGYAATDFYKIDPRFGSNELYKKLVSEAKKRGIGLIWDMVLNHCGTNYYFIKDMPEKNWVNFPDTKIRTNHLKTTNVDIHAANIDREVYEGGWFDNQMADINQRNEKVAKYLIENTIWWVEYAGLSGVRVDTYSYSDKNFLALWTKTVLNEYPNMNIVGEENTSDIGLTSYWQIDKMNNDHYKCYLPSLMDVSLAHSVVKSLNESSTNPNSWYEVYNSVAQDYQFPHPYNQMIFPDNHDMDRFYSRIGNNLALWKIGMALYMTMRGYPQFFYGTEVLMTNEKAGNDGQRRSDFYGGWTNDAKNAFTGQRLTQDELEAQRYFSKLLNWRKNAPVMADGEMIHYAPQNNIYVYFRYNNNQKIMVILNNNQTDQVLNTERFVKDLKNKSVGIDVVSGEKYILTSSITIPKQTPLILELK